MRRREADVIASEAKQSRNLVSRSRARGKIVLFCNVPPSRLVDSTFTNGANAILPDLDSALEWMEEGTLRTSAPERPRGELIPIASLDLVKELTADELAALLPLLIRRDFPAGTVICSEGEDADRMWILTKGSVSVRLRAEGHADNRRIAVTSTAMTRRGSSFPHRLRLVGRVTP